MNNIKRNSTALSSSFIWVVVVIVLGSPVSACCHPIALNWFCDWINMYLSRLFHMIIDYDNEDDRCVVAAVVVFATVRLSPVDKPCVEQNIHSSLLITYALCTISHLVECVWRCCLNTFSPRRSFDDWIFPHSTRNATSTPPIICILMGGRSLSLRCLTS